MADDGRITFRLGADAGWLEILASDGHKTHRIRDVEGLRAFLDDRGSALTPSQCRALGVIHALLVAADLSTVDSRTIERTVASYRPGRVDPACIDAFTAGEATAIFDLRRVPPAPLIASLRALAAEAL